MFKQLILSEVSAVNLFALFFVGLTTYVIIFYFRYFNRSNPLPGPIPLPIVGNLLQYPGDAGVWSNQLQSLYGDMFEVYLGTKRAVCLCRADLVEKVMNASSTTNYFLRASPNDGLDDLGVTKKGMIFNENHDDWTYHRRFMNKTIMAPHFVKDVVESTQVLFHEMEGLWKRLSDDKEIDFAGWITRFSFENVTFLTTTLRIHALTNYYNAVNPQDKVKEPEGTLPNSEDYVESIKTFFDSAAFFLLTPKVLRNFPGISGTTKRLLNQAIWLCTNLLGIVQSRRAQIDGSKETINTHDLLTQFLTINTDKDVTQKIADDHHTERMSDDDVRANMMEVLGGGTTTVSGSICFVVYHLANHPKVLARMVQELDDVLGGDRDGQITLDQLNKLEYTDAVLKEVSRVFPTVPVNFRANSRPDEIAGYKFPANTQFLINMEGIQRHSSDWTDPNAFNPDRWLTTSDTKKRNKNAFMQFGGGIRVCPGKNLALAEMKTFVALLYRKYEVELVDKATPLKYHYSFNRQCDELRVKIKRRN